MEITAWARNLKKTQGREKSDESKARDFGLKHQNSMGKTFAPEWHATSSKPSYQAFPPRRPR
jgi:hypothetical protein